eukprot:TRINITY_DN21280_c0_g1_i1.p3 TRINITY_DN21280_c0_g1~~TRINITY_DN21280_c0_g1_i1.p3  ORF type:complete len:201 (-),score=49.68 TRINITY_DN21280_c0_g1_i1:87-689(-)
MEEQTPPADEDADALIAIGLAMIGVPVELLEAAEAVQQVAEIAEATEALEGVAALDEVEFVEEQPLEATSHAEQPRPHNQPPQPQQQHAAAPPPPPPGPPPPEQPGQGTIAQLVAMGFPETACQRAVRETGYNGTEVAADWLAAHLDDPGYPFAEDTAHPQPTPHHPHPTSDPQTGAWFRGQPPLPVSYTHLTLPTKRIV